MAKKTTLSLSDRLRRMKVAGFGRASHLRDMGKAHSAQDLPERVNLLLKNIRTWYQSPKKEDQMIFFVMYDIENDRVRKQIADYLIEKGCERIQKSVYVANLPAQTYAEIGHDLKEVQEAYDNQDSILVLPISGDQLSAMRIIGEEIDLSPAQAAGEGMEWV